MNAAEKLAREIGRVATVLAHYEETKRLMAGKNVVMEPAIMLITMALEEAYVAAGTGEALAVLAAIQNLEEITE
mgnify:FL=1